MSVANCKSICREIEEADYGENLTTSAIEHLRGCRQCQGFYDERLKLRQLVASLETVAAPADFDLRVRSRIARERLGARSGFWFSNFTFGIPAVVLASLVLVVGLVVALKLGNAPTTGTVAVETGAPAASGPSPEGNQKVPTEAGVRSGAGNEELATTNGTARRRDRQPQKRSPSRNTVASLKNGGRLATKEFSVTPASVIRKEEALASAESVPIFSIETSSQPLRLSLDYSGGISRTISVPALSFGSERALTGDSSPLVKTSARGAW